MLGGFRKKLAGAFRRSLLDMDKRSGDLNQALIEITRLARGLAPQGLKHFMGLEELLFIKKPAECFEFAYVQWESSWARRRTPTPVAPLPQS